MHEILTQPIQDYLKTIHDLNASGQPAATTALAARLGISPASVTGMIQRLASATPPLVIYQKHQGVTLTPEGEKAALEVIRHHRLLETYLCHALGFTWDEVHHEACRLEHVISEHFEERIAETLGHPKRDPHGDPIPSADLSLPPDPSVPLSSLRPAQKAIIRRVRSEEADFLRHVESLELVPGAQILVLEYSPFDGNLTIEIPGRAAAALGPGITANIFVEAIS